MTPDELWMRASIGCRWLLKHQNADGSWNGLREPKVDAFYKACWALSAVGQPAAAHRTLNYVQQHFLTADGDVSPRHHPWLREVHYLYANAYVVIGSMQSGRSDIAIPSLRFLLSCQDSDHGGFRSQPHPTPQGVAFDSVSAASAGLACLTVGQIQPARHTADFLAHLIKLQPDPQHRFFTTVGPDGRLRTKIEGASDAYVRVVDTRLKNQCWYTVGVPFAFLVRLSEATGEARHRDMAQWYFDFQDRCINPWNGGSSGKAGWGCAMLYRMTGEPRYREIALHTAERITARQNNDGSWLKPNKAKNDARPAVGWGASGGELFRNTLTDAKFEVTSEYVLWMALIAANVAARDSVTPSTFSLSCWNVAAFGSRRRLEKLRAHLAPHYRRWRRRVRRYTGL